ncbi:hypothetical protein [Burkholderia anthina]|nr:hypothetical protein [Burkholderia anthina]
MLEQLRPFHDRHACPMVREHPRESPHLCIAPGSVIETESR